MVPHWVTSKPRDVIYDQVISYANEEFLGHFLQPPTRWETREKREIPPAPKSQHHGQMFTIRLGRVDNGANLTSPCSSVM